MGELLGALGLAWPRLLIYPGGLGALLLAWLVGRCLRGAQGATGNRQPAGYSPAGGRGAADNPGSGVSAGRLSSAWRVLRPNGAPPRITLSPLILPPLLALSLLPVPPARGFPYGLDLVTALALLEWPRWAALSADLSPARARALAPAYARLLLAALALAEGAGSLGLSDLLRAPDDQQALRWALLIAGAAAWLLAAAELGVGGRGREIGGLGDGGQGALLPVAPRPSPLALRTLGLVWIGALPLLGGMAALAEDRVPADLAGWALPIVALGLATLLLRAALRLPDAARRAVWWGLGLIILGLMALGG